MIYQIVSYLKFLRRSTNQHGVHSPFVYELVTECFYDKSHHPEYKLLKQHSKLLRNDHESIEVTDFGAGSRVFRSNKRKISAIAKTAGARRKRQQLLFRLVQFLKPTSILELGTSLGISTFAMALAAKDIKINTVEGCPQTANTAKKYLEKFQVENVDLQNTEFNTFLADDKSEYDFIYVDGNHNKVATLAIFERLSSKVHNNSIIIFDDIYWSREMTEAWNEIVARPEVTVSIDTFQWGLVFFRKEQVKEHFIIRV
jgi:predicted O-methyltransferase YrrM